MAEILYIKIYTETWWNYRNKFKFIYITMENISSELKIISNDKND